MKNVFAILCILCLFFGMIPTCFAEAPAYEETELTFPGEGHDIPATVCIPAGEGPFPAIVMLHGTCSTRNENGWYTKAAQILAEKYGIASIRIDFMGCGDSTEELLGYTFDSAVSDASAAAELMQTYDSVDPEKIGVLGWSQGGTDALLCASRRPELFKSAVTWAGAPDLKSCGIYTDEDYEKAKADGYYEMDLGWSTAKFSLQWCEDVLNIDVLKEFSENYSGPVLAIQGTNDTTVDPIWCGRIADASSNPASASIYIDGANHVFNIFDSGNPPIYTVIDITGEFFNQTLQ